MKRKDIALVAAILMLIPAVVNAQRGKKTVAVMNFSHYGARGIKYLAKSIPESISSSLVEVRGVRVVERAQLGRIINEIELGQTGLINTGDIQRAGKIARADILILGSVSGSRNNIIINIKAVDVVTGRLLSGKVVKGNQGNIFDKANQAAQAMGAVISGQGVGRISISTTPSDCVIYIDGVKVGTSPIVQYKVIVGKHKIRASKSGYIDYEKTVDVAVKEHVNLRPYLAEQKFLNRAEIGLGAGYTLPFNSDIKSAPNYYLFAGQSFDRLLLSVEMGFSGLKHDYDMTIPLLGTVTEERYYELLSLHGQLKFKLFPSWKYVQPFVGGIIGWTNLIDFKVYDDGTDESDSLFNKNSHQLVEKNLLALGIIGGFVLMPYSRISIYVDVRYYFHPQQITRTVYKQDNPGISVVDDANTKKFYLQYLSIGGGAKFNFDF